jgi:hypothetical protein
VDIEPCLKRELSGLKFQPTGLSEPVEVRYPFYFDERESGFMRREVAVQPEVRRSGEVANAEEKSKGLPPDSTGKTAPDRKGDIAPFTSSGLPSNKGDSKSLSSKPSSAPAPRPSPVVLPMPSPISPAGN